MRAPRTGTFQRRPMDRSRSPTRVAGPLEPSTTASFNQAWLKARPHIRAALDRQGELRLYEEEDLLAMVLRGDASLWLYGDSAVVVEIAQYPRCRSVFFRVAGGNLDDIAVLEKAVMDWAVRDYGVAFAEYIGRKGWLRAMGYTEGPTCGWKRIER